LGASGMRVKAALYVIAALILGFASISAIPLEVENVFRDGSRREGSAEGAKGPVEPFTASPQSARAVEVSYGWATLIGLWLLGLIISLGIYLIARGWASRA
jgi:hypothetical protein